MHPEVSTVTAQNIGSCLSNPSCATCNLHEHAASSSKAALQVMGWGFPSCTCLHMYAQLGYLNGWESRASPCQHLSLTDKAGQYLPLHDVIAVYWPVDLVQSELKVALAQGKLARSTGKLTICGTHRTGGIAVHQAQMQCYPDPSCG